MIARADSNSAVASWFSPDHRYCLVGLAAAGSRCRFLERTEPVSWISVGRAQSGGAGEIPAPQWVWPVFDLSPQIVAW